MEPCKWRAIICRLAKVFSMVFRVLPPKARDHKLLPSHPLLNQIFLSLSLHSAYRLSTPSLTVLHSMPCILLTIPSTSPFQLSFNLCPRPGLITALTPRSVPSGAEYP